MNFVISSIYWTSSPLSRQSESLGEQPSVLALESFSCLGNIIHRMGVVKLRTEARRRCAVTFVSWGGRRGVAFMMWLLTVGQRLTQVSQRVHRASPLDHIVSQLNPIHALILYLPSITFSSTYGTVCSVEVYRLKLCMYLLFLPLVLNDHLPHFLISLPISSFLLSLS